MKNNKFISFIESLTSDYNSNLIESIKQAYYLIESYTETLSDDTKLGTAEYIGKKVKWYGNLGQMIVIHKDYIHGMFGNIYDQSKLDNLTKMIRNANDYIELTCSYGLGEVVDLQNVIEHQQSFINDRFYEYDGFEKPYTIGNSDVDRYIVDDGIEHMIGELVYISYSDEIQDVLESIKFDYYSIDVNEIKEKLIKTIIADNSIDDEDEINDITESVESAFDAYIDIETKLNDCIKNNTGDLNTFTVQLRDAHHRVYGAINAGEEYICVNLDKESIPLVSKHNNVKLVTTLYKKSDD